MSRSPALTALFVLLAGAGCSSQSPLDFDHGHLSTGGPQTFGTGERLEYPAPPYGATVGATVDDYEFLGWSDPSKANYDTKHLDKIELAQFYDPTGEKGIKFLAITSTAVWCSACKLEYQDMASKFSPDSNISKVGHYEGEGVRFMGALFEDNNNNPAQPSDLVLWSQSFDVTFNFVLDPALKFGTFFDREATPMEMVIDTKTMQVVYIATGWATDGPNSLWAVLDSHLSGN